MKTRNLLILITFLLALLVGLLTQTFAQLPMKFSIQDQARMEMQKRLEEERKGHELRQRVLKLVQTSNKLQQRLNNPFVNHADTPVLAGECEQLAKEIKKLVP